MDPESVGGPRRRRAWRLTTRLAVALAVPAVLCASLVAVHVADALALADRKAAAERKTRLVFSATVAAHSLQNERDVAALSSGRTTDDVTKHRNATDEALRDFRAKAQAVGGGREFTERLAAVERALDDLPALRREAYGPHSGPVRTQRSYDDIVTPMLALDTELDFGDEQPMAEGWALHALSMEKAALSGQRALLNAALADGGLKADEEAAVRELSGVQQRSLQEFRFLDLGEDRARYDRIVHGAEVGKLLDRVLADRKKAGGVTVQEWHRASTAMIDQIHEVETAAAQRLLNHAAEGKRSAERAAVTGAAVAVLALLAAMAVAVLMARTLVRRLKRVRDAALQVADVQLPYLVQQISDRGGAQPVTLEAAPIDLGVGDEIGDVSRAFDAVFREAVRQTAEQAVLRTSINAMLVALSRRSQGLVHRQLEVITALESTEREPATLAELFRVDHLATRIRRHGENLLVLAGEEPGRRRSEPAPLVDVVRAAAAEVEQYTRIVPVGIPEVAVCGPVTHDITHLLAELLENATQFSRPDTPVQVSAAGAPDGGLALEIHDSGVGIPHEQLDALNSRLARDAAVDMAVTRCMGLYVVSRLASRHGMQVLLRSGHGGTTAEVLLPARLLTFPAPPAPHVPRPSPQPVTPAWAVTEQPPPTQPDPPAPEAAPTVAAGPVPAVTGQQVAPSGLPVRVPKAALRPGSAGGAAAGPAGAAPVQADELRQRAASFWHGARRARDPHPPPDTPRPPHRPEPQEEPS
ncbi:nitrate- and nitrite sensing domain-containing protein [Streptomyces sp. NPDC001404]|uniref:sensor histidine kinase n=1 Tax=Streptomyces sp. NPDC001404 TaxID=3364571 RepID=UPI00369BD03E